MFLIILGIVLFIIGTSAKRSETKITPFASRIKGLGIVVALLGALSASVRQVDAGFVGVKTLFGKVQKETMGSGLSVINPMMDVTNIDTRTQNYTMSGIHDEGSKAGDDAIKVLKIKSFVPSPVRGSGTIQCIMMQSHFIQPKEMNSNQGFSRPLRLISSNVD